MKPIKNKIKFGVTGTKKFNLLPEMEHLFCEKCITNYNTIRIPDELIFLIYCDEPAFVNDRGFGPVMKKFIKFIGYMMKVNCRVVFIRPEAPPNATRSYERNEWLQTAVPGKIGGSMADKAVVPILILDGELHDQYPWMSVVNNTGWYAGASGFGSSIYFKQKALMSMPTEQAFIFMCHEFTAHLMDKGTENDTHPSHYSYSSPYNGHCTSGGKVGKQKCMNAFIDRGYANYKNAMPYFASIWFKDPDGGSEPLGTESLLDKAEENALEKDLNKAKKSKGETSPKPKKGKETSWPIFTVKEPTITPDEVMDMLKAAGARDLGMGELRRLEES